MTTGRGYQASLVTPSPPVHHDHPPPWGGKVSPLSRTTSLPAAFLPQPSSDQMPVSAFVEAKNVMVYAATPDHSRHEMPELLSGQTLDQRVPLPWRLSESPDWYDLPSHVLLTPRLPSATRIPG